MDTYLGISTDQWLVIFTGIQAGAVSAAFAVGIRQVRYLRRQKVSESLDRMLLEWRTVGDAQWRIRTAMPLHDGTVPDRAAELALEVAKSSSGDDGGLLNEAMRSLLLDARDVVHQLNDLGAYVERDTVDQRDFFGHFHVPIAELVYLLEPYVILVSVCRGTRWGLRLRRLLRASQSYHSIARIHRSLEIRVRGRLVVSAKQGDCCSAVAWFREQRLRWRLIPSKEECYLEEDAILASSYASITARLQEGGYELAVVRSAIIG